MEAFRASRKSARAWRGELPSSSMVDTRASAMAWSDTARPRSRALLSSRMVDLQEDRRSLSFQAAALEGSITIILSSEAWRFSGRITNIKAGRVQSPLTNTN